MNKELIETIEFYLEDGLLSEKEILVIQRKAAQLGIDEIECEVMMDTLLAKKQKGNLNSAQLTNNVSGIKTEKDDSNVENVKSWFNFLEDFENEKKEFEDYISSNKIAEDILRWWASDFKSYLLKKEDNLGASFFYARVNMFVKNKFDVNKCGSAEAYFRDNINRNLVGEIYGVFYFRKSNNKLIKKSEVQNLSVLAYKCVVYSSETIVIIDREASNAKFYYFVITINDILSILNALSNMNWSSDISESESLYDIFKQTSAHLQFRSIKKHIPLKISNEVFLSRLQRVISFVKEDTNSKLMLLNNYINSRVRELNSFYSDLSDENLYIKLSKSDNKVSFNSEAIHKLAEKRRLETLLISILLNTRDACLDFIEANKELNAKELLLMLDEHGVFMNKFERSLIEKMDQLNSSLQELSSSLFYGFNALVDSMESIGNSINKMQDSLESGINRLNTNMTISNVIGIYQSSKISKISDRLLLK